jgi:hypothetical protein
MVGTTLGEEQAAETGSCVMKEISEIRGEREGRGGEGMGEDDELETVV